MLRSRPKSAIWLVQPAAMRPNLSLRQLRRIGGRKAIARYLPIAANFLEDEQLLVAFGGALTGRVELDPSGRIGPRKCPVWGELANLRDIEFDAQLDRVEHRFIGRADRFRPDAGGTVFAA